MFQPKQHCGDALLLVFLERAGWHCMIPPGSHYRCVLSLRGGVWDPRLSGNGGVRLRHFDTTKDLHHRVSVLEIDNLWVHARLKFHRQPRNSPTNRFALQSPDNLKIRLAALVVWLAPDAVNEYRIWVIGNGFAASHVEGRVGGANGLDATSDSFQLRLSTLCQQGTRPRIFATTTHLVEKLANNVGRLWRCICGSPACCLSGGGVRGRCVSAATDHAGANQCGCDCAGRVAGKIVLGGFTSHDDSRLVGRLMNKLSIPCTLRGQAASSRIRDLILTSKLWQIARNIYFSSDTPCWRRRKHWHSPIGQFVFATQWAPSSNPSPRTCAYSHLHGQESLDRLRRWLEAPDSSAFTTYIFSASTRARFASFSSEKQ